MEQLNTPTFTLKEADQLISESDYSSIFILVDSNTHQHCLPLLQRSCPSLRDVEVLEVEPGEAQKDIEIVAGLWQAMLELGADRNTLLVCLGGGVITDLGGFIASTFKRGIDFLLIPTSVLAMVDAAIGGKTGINLGGSKNQVGTFCVGRGIVHHPPFLETLPERELKAGYAEMLKHALLDSQETLDRLLKHPVIGLELIMMESKNSQELKARVVAEDPKEEGLRKTLNLGHTAGHAIEALTQSSENSLNHGECVALGMQIALKLSSKHCGLEAEIAEKVVEHIAANFPPMPQLDEDALWKRMLEDKKNQSGKVLFVLLDSIGQAKWGIEVSRDQFFEVYRELLSR